MNYEITHFRIEQPTMSRMKTLSFYSRTLDSNQNLIYVEGTDLSTKIKEKELQRLVEQGIIGKLSRPYIKKPDFALFLNQAGDVVLAPKSTPNDTEFSTIVARIETISTDTDVNDCFELDIESELIGMTSSEKISKICIYIKENIVNPSLVKELENAILGLVLDLEADLRITRELLYTKFGFSKENIKKMLSQHQETYKGDLK